MRRYENIMACSRCGHREKTSVRYCPGCGADFLDFGWGRPSLWDNEAARREVRTRRYRKFQWWNPRTWRAVHTHTRWILASEDRRRR